jgi:hypothetical protein
MKQLAQWKGLTDVFHDLVRNQKKLDHFWLLSSYAPAVAQLSNSTAIS